MRSPQKWERWCDLFYYEHDRYPNWDELIVAVQQDAQRWDNPKFDATDAAHPAWWRGHDRTAKKFEELVNELRAKLAEAERKLSKFKAQWQCERDRAEAAEARFEELRQDRTHLQALLSHFQSVTKNS